MQNFDKDKIKYNLSIEEVQTYVDDLGGESRQTDDNTLVCKTICHGGNSHKLYYYHNTHLFCCYTDCGERFDIYELTQKVFRLKGEKWSLPRAIAYVASYFGYDNISFDLIDYEIIPEDWEYLNKHKTDTSLDNNQTVELKTYSDIILSRLPKARILDWEKEGISYESVESHNIKYNPIDHGIIIPHYDINNKLIGIRERTLIADNEIYGKYRPAILNGQMYNHPLSFNLYNLNHSKENIAKMKTAIVFEGEKATLLYQSLFGKENDISVACCGSSLITYQVKLLLNLDVNEIIVAFDKQFQKPGDEEFKRWVKKLKQIHKKYSKYVNISFAFDKENNLLNYKDSPIDQGKENFLKLFQNRIVL